MGAWGAVQATAAGVAIASAGVIRDVVLSLPIGSRFGTATPYLAVFALEVLFLVLALIVIVPLLARSQDAE